MVRLYHYTSKLNMEQILRSGWLRKSLKHPIGWINGEMLKNGAAFFTEKDPCNFSKEEIAQNNWGQGWKERVKAGLVDAYIVLDVPEGSRDFIFDWDPAHNVVAHIGDLQLEKFDCLWGYTNLTFSLLSFNVHHVTNVPKVAELLNANLSDIICLQECKDQVLQQILSALTTEYFYHQVNGSAILTRFKFEPITEFGWTEHRGFLTIWLPDIGLYLTCLHLDQKQEKTRVGEVWDVMEARWVNNLDPMILVGDFNSLKREDYNFEKWEEISKVTRKCVDLFRLVKTADNCNLR